MEYNGVLIRVTCKSIDANKSWGDGWADGWCRSLLGDLGGFANTRWDVWMCHHERVGTGCVLEALVERARSSTPLSVSDVEAAARRACPDGETHAFPVLNPRWFAESIRQAASANGPVHFCSWNPATRSVQASVTSTETGETDPRRQEAWCMLHGWLASVTETTELWHPRAPCAHSQARLLVGALCGNRELQY